MYSSYRRPFIFNEITANPGRHTDASHGSDYHYLALMYEGSSRIVCPTHRIDMTAGEAFYIPRGCRYHSYWDGDHRVSWATLGFSSFPESDEGFILQKISLSQIERETLIHLAHHKKSDSASLGMFYSMLDGLLSKMKREPPSQKKAITDAAKSYMRENPKAPIAEVARHCRISESGLFATFRSQGKTPALTRQELQIEAAIDLISSSSLTADEIAERVGFGSTSYFLRTLKKHTGKTTKGIRNENGQI